LCAGKQVDRTLHLKQVTRFSQEGTTTSSPIPPPRAIAPPPPRAQPNGLRASYLPIGIPPAPLVLTSREDVDMTDALPASQSSKKRKHHAGEGETTPRVKSKKARKQESSTAPPQSPKMSGALLGEPGSTLKRSSGLSDVKMTSSPAQPATSSNGDDRKETPVPVPQYGRVSSNDSRSPERGVDSTTKDASKTGGKGKSKETKTPVRRTINNLEPSTKKSTPIMPPSYGQKKRS
jgi:hypothetical protein